MLHFTKRTALYIHERGKCIVPTYIRVRYLLYTITLNFLITIIHKKKEEE